MVDALCSGRSARKGVLVRIQSWAQIKSPARSVGFFYGCDRSVLRGEDRKNTEVSEASQDLFVCKPPRRTYGINESNPVVCSIPN